MPSISVALIEPQYHVNAGHVARLMKNFGLRRLYFVRPHFDGEEALKYATHGGDILTRARTVTFSELRRKFDFLIGTTAILATSRLNVLRESVSASELARIVDEGSTKRFCIVLGREASGLNNKELAACDLVCIIDTKTGYRTMNIAHALAIILYEITRLSPSTPAKRTRKTVGPASQQDILLLLEYLGKLAEAGNFDLHKKPLLDAAVRKMIAKSQPTEKDVMLLVSLFRKGVLAIERRGGANLRSKRQS